MVSWVRPFEVALFTYSGVVATTYKRLQPAWKDLQENQSAYLPLQIYRDIQVFQVSWVVCFSSCVLIRATTTVTS